jgi:hypothetical protein
MAPRDPGGALSGRLTVRRRAVSSRLESRVGLVTRGGWRSIVSVLARLRFAKLTGLNVSNDDWDWLDAIHPADRDRVRAA